MHAVKDQSSPGLHDYQPDSPTKGTHQLMINDTSVAQFDTSSRNNRGAVTDMSMGHRRNTSLPGIGMSKTLLSNAGASIMRGMPEKKVQLQTNFLRKHMGRGGSPTEFDLVVPEEHDDKQSGRFMVPVRR